MALTTACIGENLGEGVDMTVTPLRVRRPPVRDLAAAERAARAFLTALGLDVDDDGLADTPGRMARAYAELLTPR